MVIRDFVMAIVSNVGPFAGAVFSSLGLHGMTYTYMYMYVSPYRPNAQYV